MWVVGDWGQDSPWSRTTGVKMVKGANDVYTGELSLPKGTKFDIRILKSTFSSTSGGENTWSAAKYASTLNTSTSHDFGEFTDNFINGNLDKGQVGWTPDTVIKKNDMANTPPNVIELSEGESVLSDVFTIPPNQNVRFTGYCTSVLEKVLSAYNLFRRKMKYCTMSGQCRHLPAFGNHSGSRFNHLKRR